MLSRDRLPPAILSDLALTALAPMQDVTDLAFMKAIALYGSPDYFFTEYFRVYSSSRLEKHILRSITENTTGRPIFAQLIGDSIPDLVRPAPRIYRKNVGGGLLRDPDSVDRILGELRARIQGLFTVKMRIGFEDTDNLDHILSLINHHQIDLLSLHGRTVKQMYRGAVQYDRISHAVQMVKCPVLANGNVTSAATAATVLKTTGASGVMIGRAAIRNPWIFQQIRQLLSGQTVAIVTLSEVRDYIDRLHNMVAAQTITERSRVNSMKKYLNFIGESVDAAGAFLRDMRLTRTEVELFEICDRYLLSEPNREFALEPYPGLVARPSCETACEMVDGIYSGI
jgi:tRNA-dihydrouridine synthase B